jgi:hypothetical protein
MVLGNRLAPIPNASLTLEDASSEPPMAGCKGFFCDGVHGAGRASPVTWTRFGRRWRICNL